MYIIVGVLSLMVILCFVLIIALSTKLEKVTRRQNLISSHLSGETVDVLLEKSIDRQEELAGQIQKNQENIKKLQDHSLKTFDKIEVLRYSSNPDDENDTSFSIGITNLEENGIIITGLQSSTGTKLLAKKVKRGSAEDDVTDEELSVIDRDN